MKRIVHWAVGALFLALFYLFADSIVTQIGQIRWSLKSLFITAALSVPVIASSLVALAYILRHDDAKSLSRAALSLVIFSLLCRLAWISAFDSYQQSDFGGYINCGADVALTGNPSSSANCGGDDGYVYWKRSAFYTYPIALLFGRSLVAVKIVNVLILTLAALVFFHAGRMIFGPKTAAIGLIFFIWHPDLWYSVTLASHDVPGMFWLAVFFLLWAFLQRSLLNPSSSNGLVVASSICLGGSIFFLAVVRSYQYGAILALTIYAAIHLGLLLTAKGDRHRDFALLLERRYGAEPTVGKRLLISGAHACLLLAIPLLVYMLATRSFWRSSGVRLEADDAGLLCYVTSLDVLGEGRYEQIDNWSTQCPEIARGERTAFAIRKVLHDVTHDPGGYLHYLLRKNRVLSRADDYLYWSASKEHETWDPTYTQVRRVNSRLVEEQSVLLYFAHAAVLMLVACRFLLYPALPFRLAEAVPILFSAVYYFMFLFFLEAQGRYEVFLVFIFSWMAAQAIQVVDTHFRRRPSDAPVHECVSRRSIYTGGVFVVAVAGVLFWGVSSAAADGFLTLRDQSGFTPVPRDDLPPAERGSPRVPPLFLRNNYKELMLAYPVGASVEPGSVMAVQRTFMVRPRTRHHLRLFLSTRSVTIEPFAGRIPWDNRTIEYLVAVNGAVVAAGKLSDVEANKYLSFYPGRDLKFAPKMTVQLVLRNTVRIERVAPNRSPILSLEYIDLQ